MTGSTRAVRPAFFRARQGPATCQRIHERLADAHASLGDTVGSTDALDEKAALDNLQVFLAQDLRRQVYEMVSEGRSDAEIVFGCNPAINDKYTLVALDTGPATAMQIT